ncbi:carbon-nitrogen family hydrolase [Streptomyces sp. SID13666]|uniref:carbon-nitrogen family hydrolase n=1 Tax=Streptomyces TaxID=1883 RepID=UPI001106A3AB|nr:MULTISPECIES: carbon-nitrogen family hydrolase [Streptomyces]MCZ4094895.1 carbon-nitrogen family hydrolase [Streptomyces sp. H39-C1]NEA57623.1 carbon-nitrogen family hydrolase [Streptomyces sp. SID13666]NEA72573.1 carbon-nitrogen family hydrolase [Streptomyces sp. SID13588]QNA74369.1 carbon-nitrogen family hydrolase [Streptomyces sp. So13.3]
MRASLLQIDVDLNETVADRRDRVAALVRAQGGTDLVVLPELWPVGAFASDTFAAEAEPLDGPTADAMSAAARDAGVWLHAGSIVERDPDGPLYNTSLVFGPDGELRHTYRKIHRFGFDQGEAALMAPGEEIVTVALPDTVLGLATCYDLRFPEQFRLLVDAGAQMLVIPAGWPAKRREHWRLLARARAVESQTYVLACGTAGTHAGVELAGHSMVVDPWGDIVAEAGTGEEILTVDLDPALVTKTRHDFPVLRDRRLG